MKVTITHGINYGNLKNFGCQNSKCKFYGKDCPGIKYDCEKYIEPTTGEYLFNTSIKS